MMSVLWREDIPKRTQPFKPLRQYNDFPPLGTAGQVKSRFVQMTDHGTDQFMRRIAA
jgi:hypothetical protein